MGDSKNITIPAIRPWRAGETLSEGRLNETTDTVNRLIRGVEGPRQVESTVPFSTASSGFPVRGVYFKTHHAAPTYEFLRVVWDTRYLTESPPADQRVDVALPYQLRVHPWQENGRPWVGTRLFTYEYDPIYKNKRTARLATGDASEDQQITPSYQIGDMLLIARVPTQALLLPPVDHGIMWIDLNIDSRCWAALPRASAP